MNQPYGCAVHQQRSQNMSSSFQVRWRDLRRQHSDRCNGVRVGLQVDANCQ